MPDAKVEGRKVTTGEVRLSYANLFEPRSQGDDDTPKYSCVLIIPKEETRTLKALEKARKQAIEEGKSGVFGGKVPPVVATTLHDGDEEGDLERNPEYEGCMFMNVSSKRQPGLIDRQKMEITSPEDLHSGDYVRVELGAFAYNYKGKKGVSFGLNHVQKLRDGENLSGLGGKAEEAFDDLDDLDDDDDNDLI